MRCTQLNYKLLISENFAISFEIILVCIMRELLFSSLLELTELITWVMKNQTDL